MPGAGGVVRAGVLVPVDGGAASTLERVTEMFTSSGSMPNFSSVDDTASERRPGSYSVWLVLSWRAAYFPAADVFVSDENMLCR